MDTQRNGYGAVARALHWLIAALMILQWFSGEESKAFGGMGFHFSLGLTLMLLVLVRLGWRVTHPAPPLPQTSPAWERGIARIIHLSWYVLMLALPLSGILYRQFRGKITSWFGLADMPAWLTPDKYWAHQSEEIHKILGVVFLVLLTLHVVAALKHHFIDRDGVLRGMLLGSPGHTPG